MISEYKELDSVLKTSEARDRYIKTIAKCEELEVIIKKNAYILARNGVYEDLCFVLSNIQACAKINDSDGVLVQTNYIIDELHYQL